MKTYILLVPVGLLGTLTPSFPFKEPVVANETIAH